MDSVVEVVGTFYTNAEQILRNIIKDNGEIWNVGGYQYHEIILTLMPEPENEYDPLAIAVYSNYPTPPRAKISRSGKIGYLPRGTGISVSKPSEVEATIKEGFGKFFIKINISPFIKNEYSNKDYDEYIDELADELASENAKSYTSNIQTSKSSNSYQTANQYSRQPVLVNKFVFAGLAVFLGIFGIHWFYAQQPKRGLKYLLFCWTSIPFFLGIYQGIKAIFTRTDSTLLIKV